MTRILDFIFSLIFIIILSFLFVVIICLIICDSKGGAFFCQTRVGKNNKDFTLLKFRTMYKDSDKKGLLTVGNHDPRITPIGVFLRKSKLDELPQLFNILLGQMSFVGPRPEVRKYVNLYTEDQRKVLSVPPGLSDYASIEYIDENELLAKAVDKEQTYIQEIMPAKIKLNMIYINNKSVYQYFKIIFSTLHSLIKK